MFNNEKSDVILKTMSEVDSLFLPFSNKNIKFFIESFADKFNNSNSSIEKMVLRNYGILKSKSLEHKEIYGFLKDINTSSINLSEYSNMLKSPIDFNLDSDGTLLITKHDSVSFMQIYSQSHKLLLTYEKAKNIEGIKYELSKLWYMCMIIECKIMHNNTIMSKFISEEKKKEALKSRAFILNDYKKYMTIVMNAEKDFNFQEYFNNTSFGKDLYRLDSKTIKAIKLFLSNLLV